MISANHEKGEGFQLNIPYCCSIVESILELPCKGEKKPLIYNI